MYLTNADTLTIKLTAAQYLNADSNFTVRLLATSTSTGIAINQSINQSINQYFIFYVCSHQGDNY